MGAAGSDGIGANVGAAPVDGGSDGGVDGAPDGGRLAVGSAGGIGTGDAVAQPLTVNAALVAVSRTGSPLRDLNAYTRCRPHDALGTIKRGATAAQSCTAIAAEPSFLAPVLPDPGPAASHQKSTVPAVQIAPAGTMSS
jgi:hypothetical protein